MNLNKDLKKELKNASFFVDFEKEIGYPKNWNGYLITLQDVERIVDEMIGNN